MRLEDKSTIHELPPPFLANLADDFVIVKSIDHGKISYDWYGHDIVMSESDFIQGWSGVVLLAYPNKHSIEPDYNKHKKEELERKGKIALISITFLTLFLCSFLIRDNINFIDLLLSVFEAATNLGGLYITYLLLLKQLHIDSSVTFQEYIANMKLRWQKNNFSSSFKVGGHYTAARQHYADTYINDGGDVSYTFNAQYLMPWKTSIESTLAVLTHYGYSDPEMNKTNWVMNAGISQPLIKNKLTMRLVAFDLFHEIKNYRRTFENNIWQEATRNTLRNYFMLSLVYRFNKEPKNAP